MASRIGDESPPLGCGLFLAYPDVMTALELDDVGTRWMAAMKRGDFEAAWRQTDRIERERRALAAAARFEPQAHHLVWDGTPFDGRRVLIRCTHGLGDTLQFVRYVPLVRERARSVCLLVQPQLLPLFAATRDFGDVHNAWNDEPPREHDVEIEIMELPYAFRSTAETLPKSVPYLPLDGVRYADRLGGMNADGVLKVGLLWAASDWDKTRSISLQVMEPLGRVRGVKFFSLQQGAEAGAWCGAPFAIEPLHRHTAEVAAAAAAMQKLDLVITVDSMAAHLAGALARPVWVLLRHEADWRWMSDRADSPWYPTMRLFRERGPDDWTGVVESVAAELKQAAVNQSR
jgi:hypothetical protein